MCFYLFGSSADRATKKSHHCLLQRNDNTRERRNQRRLRGALGRTVQCAEQVHGNQWATDDSAGQRERAKEGTGQEANSSASADRERTRDWRALKEELT